MEFYRVQALGPDDWPVLKRLRLLALKESPHAFVERYEVACEWDEAQWRRQFEADENALVKGSPHWFVVQLRNYRLGIVCLRTATDGLDVVGDAGSLTAVRYAESLWVRRGFRQSGAGSQLLRAAADHYGPRGVTHFRAWLLDGNQDAWNFYLRLGFSRFGERKPVPGHPGLFEQCLQIPVEALTR